MPTALSPRLVAWCVGAPLLSMLASATGGACLNGHPSVQHEYRSSLFVLVGRAIDDKATPESGQYLDGNTYTVLVKEVLKGQPPKTVRLFSENTSGCFTLDIGETYLLFVDRELGRLVVDSCGNSGLVSRKDAELSAVRKLVRPGA